MRWAVSILLALTTPAHADRAGFDAAKQLHTDAQARDRACRDQACRQQLVPLFQGAQAAWAAYLAKFPADPTALEAHFFNAELLYWKLGKLEEAGDEYMIVARSKPVGTLHRDALVNAIDAYDRSRGKQAGPIDHKLRAAAELYAEIFAGGPDTVAILFKLAQLEFDRGNNDEAMKRFLLIVTQHPKSPEAGPAGERAIEIAARTSDYQLVWDLAQKLATAPAFASSNQQARLVAIRAAASMKLAEREADAGRFAKAAELFARAAKESERTRDGAQALMNAGVMFEKARLADRAVETYREVAVRYPNENVAPLALWTIAHVEEAVMRWDRAANAYDQLVMQYPSDPRLADALYNIGVLRAALGEPKRAIAALDRYVKQFPMRADVARSRMFAAELREQSGDLPGALAAFTAITGAREELAVEVHLAAGRVAIALGKDQLAEKHVDAAVDLGRPLRSKRMLAEALLWRARLAMRAADRVSVAPPAKLATALATKTKLWTAADARFDDVVATGEVGFTIAALRERGASREQLAHTIETLPAPASSPADQTKAYREQLAQYATAMRAQAIDLYQAAYAKALQLGNVGADAVAIRQALVRLGALPADNTTRSDVRIAPAPQLDYVFR